MIQLRGCSMAFKLAELKNGANLNSCHGNSGRIPTGGDVEWGAASLGVEMG